MQQPFYSADQSIDVRPKESVCLERAGKSIICKLDFLPLQTPQFQTPTPMDDAHQGGSDKKTPVGEKFPTHDVCFQLALFTIVSTSFLLLGEEVSFYGPLTGEDDDVDEGANCILCLVSPGCVDTEQRPKSAASWGMTTMTTIQRSLF